MDSSLSYLTIAELVEGYQARKFSPVEVVETHLHRIEQLNDVLGAFITVAGEESLAAARRVEERILRGEVPAILAGVPIGLKDTIDTKDLPTTWGAGFRRGVPAREDAALVKGLLEAGAIIVGKHNLLEFAMGGIDYNPHYGPIRNPWNIDRFPGGSSSGTAAAVAAGLCVGGVGTDTGGSIRQPSSYCGITGLKTTLGLVSLRGVFPLSDTTDVAGPIGRSAKDVAIILEALVGRHGEFDRYIEILGRKSLSGVRVGIDRSWVEDGADDEVFELWSRALTVLEESGARIVDVTIPEPRDLRGIYQDIVYYETFLVHKQLYETYGEDFGPEASRRMDIGSNLTSDTYDRAQLKRKALTQAANDLFRGVDVITFPTQPTTAPILGSGLARFNGDMVPITTIRGRFAGFASFTGFPALTVPIGFNSEGLPAGLEIVGPASSEESVLRVGHAYQEATSWHAQHPRALSSRP